MNDEQIKKSRGLFLMASVCVVVIFGVFLFWSSGVDKKQDKKSALVLDMSIANAKSFFVSEYLKNSLETVKKKKVIVLFDKDGKAKQVDTEYVPKKGEEIKIYDTYVEYQLYIVIHFLMYFKDWGYDPSDPLVQDAKKWLVSTFDEKEGRWLWSPQGCLHPKAIIALVRIGEIGKAKKAMQWALQSQLKTKGGFIEHQNGRIIHSLAGPKDILSGEDFILRIGIGGGEKPPLDATPITADLSAKYLYAMALLGMDNSSDFVEIKGYLLDYLNRNSLKSFTNYWYEATAVSWIIFAYENNNVTKDELYNKAKSIVIAIAEDDLKNDSLQNYARAKILHALSLVQDDSVTEIKDAIVQKMLIEQLASGAWEFDGRKNIKEKGVDAIWYESKRYGEGLILNHMGSLGSATKTTLEALVVYRKN